MNDEHAVRDPSHVDDAIALHRRYVPPQDSPQALSAWERKKARFATRERMLGHLRAVQPSDGFVIPEIRDDQQRIAKLAASFCTEARPGRARPPSKGKRVV